MWRNFIQTSQSLGTTLKLKAARRAGNIVIEELLGQDESRQLVGSVQIRGRVLIWLLLVIDFSVGGYYFSIIMGVSMKLRETGFLF